MTTIFIVLAIVFVIGAAIGVYAWLAPRTQEPAHTPPAQLEPWEASTDWTTQAGDEFAGLSESARCDLIFAVSALNDDRSQRLLVHALDDPSDAVALAAAHALGRRGSTDTVTQYAQQHPGDRAQRIVQTLALLQ